jgi:hypothetical protein
VCSSDLAAREVARAICREDEAAVSACCDLRNGCKVCAKGLSISEVSG